MRPRLLFLLAVLLCLVQMLLLAYSAYLDEGAILVGWIGFIRRNFPQATIEPAGIATGAVFLLLLVALIEIFARSVAFSLPSSSKTAGASGATGILPVPPSGDETKTAETANISTEAHWRDASGTPRRWRFRWTLSIVAALFLMFAVGYSTIGLARHIGWMATSKEPHYRVQVDRIPADASPL
ncbi:MAG: hypothetical protein IT426_09320 [Pirellulales bacterium]|nr:hypothetical protein [Pirellulales bacterium]